MNIDIHSFSIELFNYLRPKDLNYNFAVSDKIELINMYFQKELSQLSTVDYNQAKKITSRTNKREEDTSIYFR